MFTRITCSSNAMPGMTAAAPRAVSIAGSLARGSTFGAVKRLSIDAATGDTPDNYVLSSYLVWIAVVLLATLVAGLVRVVRGPAPADRMLAIQLFGTRPSRFSCCWAKRPATRR